MNMLKAMLVILMVCLSQAAHVHGQSNQPPARIAVICLTPEAIGVTDILQAKLSQNSSLVLLERTEIQRIFREQSLSVVDQSPVAIGNILGADGLVMMETIAVGTNRFLATRLTAVKSGVVLISERFTWPIGDAVSWAEGLADRLDRLTAKLQVSPKEAIPISVVNLRSTMKSEETEKTELELKLLTIHRLVREPRFFVLERRKMQSLEEEKSLSNKEDSAFWNGAYLLDGIVDPKGYTQEAITISARLMPPKGGTPMVLEVSGSRSNLSEVIDRLVALVSQRLNIDSTVSAWNTDEEAERYIKEAKWALEWGVLPEAQTACETSWALGRRTMDTAKLRTQINLARAQLPYSTPFYMDLFFSSPLDPAPDYNKLPACLQAIEQYEADFKRFVVNEQASNTNWLNLGIDALYISAELLRHYYHHPESRTPYAEQLTELRESSRSLLKMIADHPPYAARRNLFATIKGTWGQYWLDSPEDGLHQFRALYAAGAGPDIRLAAANHNFVEWKLTGFIPHKKFWKPIDPPAIASQWSNFIIELSSSSNGLTQMEGYYLAMAAARPADEVAESDQRFVECARQLFKVALQNGEAYGANFLTASSFIQDVAALIPHTWYGEPDLPHNKAVINLLQSFQIEFAPKVEQGGKRRWLAALTRYFNSDDRFNFDEFHKLRLAYQANSSFRSDVFDSQPKGDLTVLLQSLDEWHKRYTNQIPARTRGSTPFPSNIQSLRREISQAQTQAATAETHEQNLALLEAIDAGNLAAAVLALKNGANIETKNAKGWTPLIIAANSGREDLTQYLLEQGADANTRSTGETGTTVLCIATGTGKLSIVEALVRHRADVNARSANLIAPLYIAVARNFPEIVNFLLSQGANPNIFGPMESFQKSQSPLTLAILNRNFEIARSLLQRGANLESTNNLGETTLMTAAGMSNPDSTRFLIEKGANVNATGPRGHTSLFYSAYHGRIENVRLLLDAGAAIVSAPDPDRPNSPLYDATAIAELKGYPEIATLIKSRHKIPVLENSTATQTPTNGIVAVSRFWEPAYSSPTELNQAGLVAPWAITDNYCFREGRLWFLFHAHGKSRQILAMNPDDFAHQQIELPYDDVDGFEVFSNNIYISTRDKIACLRVSSGAWEELPIPTDGKPKLKVAGGRLMTFTQNAILEISPLNHDLRLIASRRRNPPANILDSLGLYRQCDIGSGPNGQLRVRIGNTIYEEGHSNWEALTNPPIAQQPSRTSNQDDTFLISGIVANRYQLYALSAEQNSFKPLLSTRIDDWQQRGANPQQNSMIPSHERSQWTSNRKPSTANRPVIYHQNKLWIFDGQIEVQARWIDSQNVVLVSGQELRAELLLFEPEFADPIVIPIRLNLEKLLRHADFLDSMAPYGNPGQIGMISLGNTIFQRIPKGMVVGASRLPGFWFIPDVDLQDEIQRQRLLLAREARKQAEVSQADWDTLAERYQLSVSSNFPPDVLERMINDELFLELHLPQIDANQDGWLDYKELVYFDANQNGRIDPPEEKGIQVAQRLLAKSNFKIADDNEDGRIDRMEQINLMNYRFRINNPLEASASWQGSQSIEGMIKTLDRLSSRSVFAEASRRLQTIADPVTRSQFMFSSRTNQTLIFQLDTMLGNPPKQ